MSAPAARLACVLALVAACTGTGPAGTAAPAPSPLDVLAVAERVNRHREHVGCAPLEWLQGAARAAQSHSRDMARRGYFSHRSPEGHGPRDRLLAEGVTPLRVAEKIALTAGGGADAVRLWLNSPPHRRNLEDCALTHHGLGESSGYWTYVLVTPRAE